MQKPNEATREYVHYTIYLKNLRSDTGYVDIFLESDQLLKDYLQFLDMGVRVHKSYPVANVPGIENGGGLFAIDVAEIAAITTHRPLA